MKTPVATQLARAVARARDRSLPSPLRETMETSALLGRFYVPISFDDGIRRREQGDVGKLPEREKATIRSPGSGDENIRVEENALPHARGGGSCGILSGSRPNFPTSRRATA